MTGHAILRNAPVRPGTNVGNLHHEKSAKELSRHWGRQEERQIQLSSLQNSELARLKQQREQELELDRVQMEQRLEELKAQVEALVQRAHAVSPDLVAALQSFSDQHLAERVAQSMSPLAILGGKSVAEVFSQLLKGSPLEAAVRRWGQKQPEEQ